MRILLACEHSAVCREAFKRKGWEAWSCDLKKTNVPGNHIQGDVLEIIDDDWDMIIGFPPCTYLSAASSNLYRLPERIEKKIAAAAFFMKIYNAKCKLVGVENPRGAMSCIFRKPDQEIHPWYFGEEQMKRTCLWLKGLPRLRYSIGDNLFETNTATMKPSPINIQINKATGKIKKRYFTDCIIDNKLRTQESKSIFTKAVANAMAEQWTNFYLQKK